MQFEHNQFDNLLDDETTEDLNTETQEEVIEPAGNSTEEEEEDSSSSEEGTEETEEEDDLDAFSSFLKSRGIRDGKLSFMKTRKQERLKRLILEL